MKTPTAKKLPSGRWRVQVMVDGNRVSVTADSEKEAIAKAMEMKPDQIRWSGEDGKTPPFLAAYAERAE